MQVDIDNRDKARIIAEYDKRQELRASHIANVIGCLQEKKKEWEEQLKQDRMSRDFDGMNCIEKWEYFDGCAQRDIQIIETLEEIINQNSL